MQPPIRLELPTPFGIDTVNSWLFLEPEVTLIDCGMQHEFAVLEAALAEHGLTIADVERVIITHAHIDHMGAVGEVARKSNAVFECGPATYPWVVDFSGLTEIRAAFVCEEIRKSSTTEEINTFERQSFDYIVAHTESAPAARVREFDPEQPLQLGGLDWQVIYQPGHCQHQYAFYQPEQKWLLSADSLLSITPISLIDFELGSLTERNRALPTWLKSVGVLYDLDVDVVFPGHGLAIEDHRKTLERQYRRIEKRKNQCYDLIKSGLTTPYAVAADMYAHFSTQAMPMAITMIYGYVDLLAAEGKIKIETVADVYQLRVIQ